MVRWGEWFHGCHGSHPKVGELGNEQERRPDAPATVPGIQYVSREDHQQAEAHLRAKDPRLKHRVSIERSKVSSSVMSNKAAEEASRSRCESPGTLYDRKMAAHEEELTRKASLDPDALIRDQRQGREGFGNDGRDGGKAPSSWKRPSTSRKAKTMTPGLKILKNLLMTMTRVKVALAVRRMPQRKLSSHMAELGRLMSSTEL
ncbi:hypothetical protein MHU86_8134 [Fragilaria crotonensis]|nr:hypothetical protein MHU86_8134 [Fragilaria crotonensis]